MLLAFSSRFLQYMFCSRYYLFLIKAGRVALILTRIKKERNKMRYMFVVTILSLLCFSGHVQAANDAMGQSSLYKADKHYNMALQYYLGQGVDRDYGEAVRHWHISAEDGHKDSQFMLGDMYYHGRGVEKDRKKSYAWFDTAARQGFVQAGPARDKVVGQMSSLDLEQARLLAEKYFQKYARP